MALRLSPGHTRSLDRGLGRAQVQLIEHAVVELELQQLETVLARLQGLFAQSQLPTVGPQGVVGIGHGGNQADVSSFARLFRGQHLGRCRLAQRFDATKQVQLIGRHRDPACDRGGQGIRRGARRAPCATDAAIEGRETIRVLDLVCRAQLIHIEDCDTQVTVVVQSLADQALQLGIGEVAGPR